MEAIHDYLQRIAKDLRDGAIPLAQFVINKVRYRCPAPDGPFRRPLS